MSHGTESGYKRHWRTHIPACAPCKAAHAAAESRRRAKQLEVHGTPEGISYHRRSKTPVCDMCLYLACSLEHEQTVDYLAECHRNKQVVAA